MKYKKIVSTVLACALAVTTAFSGNVASVEAAAKPTIPEESTLLGSYDFNPAGTSTDGTLGENVKMVNSGTNGSIPAAYTGQAVYGEGRTGQAGDKAIQLGTYGLELPQKNIGTDYTVSMWAKPTSDTINMFSPLLFLGYHSPEKWVGIAAEWHEAGTKYTNKCILWGINSGLNASTEIHFDAKQDEWVMITVTQTGKNVSVYRNGQLAGIVTITNDVLQGQNQGIYIGANAWDKEFPALVDDINVYKTALNSAQVRYLYDGKTEAEVFSEAKDNIKVTSELSLKVGDTNRQISVEGIPASVVNAEIEYNSSDPEKLTVNPDNGEITILQPSESPITVTTTIKVGNDKVERTTSITVMPIDKTVLNAQLTEARAKCQDTNYTEKSRRKLQVLIDSADSVTSQAEVDDLVNMIKNAISKLESSELFKNPFTGINDKIAAETAMAPNQSIEVFKDLIPADIKNMVTVTYTSSNPAVAAINPSTGVVTAGAIGYARVTAVVKAKYDNFEMEYQTLVKVNVDMNGVTAKADTDTLAKGGKTKITVNMASVSSLSPSVSYRATGAVSVDKSGNVAGKSAGTGKVYVKVTAGGKSVTRTVVIKVGDITGKSSVKVKKSITLKVSGITGKVKWSVDKSKYAKISQKGKLTAKKKGKVTVTAKVGKITMKKKITIKK